MNPRHATRPDDFPPIVLYNARLVDPASNRDEIGGIIVVDGMITKIGADVTSASAKKGIQAIDCRGHVLCPGLIDMQVFVGEPGIEHRETLESATQAAAAGGVTTIVTMPNTDPVIDNVALVDFIKRRARDTGIVHVCPMAALTTGLEGTQMSELGLLMEAGAVGLSDGGRTIRDAQLLRRILDYARNLDTVITVHAEEPGLARDGVMNEGEIATRLGLTGIPAAAEVIIIERDLRLVELTGAKLHFSQISSRAAVDVIAAAKREGRQITSGVSAAHLLLNENDIGSYRTFVKLSPPLRSEDDRLKLIEGLAQGTIDVIVSSHNPQSADTKRHPFAEAAAGAIGLETLLPSVLSLHHNEQVPLMRLIEAMTSAPARLLGLDAGRLEEGLFADLALIDLEAPWIVDPAAFRSKSKNTPFEAHKLQGRVLRTMIAGQTVYEYSG